MIRDILLIMPNFSWKIDFDVQKDPPMGILSIASVLEGEGYNIKVLDANAKGLSVNEIIDVVKDFKPDLVGISCNYSPLNNISLILCSSIKSIDSGIIVVVGGNHATASYKYMLGKSNDSINFIIRGQGEKILSNLISAINENGDFSNVKGIAYKSDDTITATQDEDIIDDLDTLPMPAYHLVDMGDYDRYNIISSRGCPYHCNYCASNVISRKVKYRSPAKIVQEIELLINNWGYKHFWFSDDTFTSNYKHTNEFLDIILNKGLKFTWSCMTRVNNTSIEILKKMKLAGCKYISYGLESGDEYILEQMNKNIRLEDVKNALKLTKEAGIDMYTFFLIGYPGETVESINKSFELINEIRPTGVSFAIVIPLPGTPLWNYLESRNIISFDNIEWDYLFAKTGNGKYEDYSAVLATRWCDIPAKDLVDFCKTPYV